MRRPIATCTAIALAGAGTVASARHHQEFTPPASFMLQRVGVGGAEVAAPTPAFLASSRIAAADTGSLVIDADSGTLVLANTAGASTSQLAIGHDAGLLAFDPIARLAYIADRRGDRIVVVKVGDTLSQVTTWKTAAEPYGIALTPDRKTALVTTIADRQLVAYDTATGKVQWSTRLDQEPRGIAVSSDGRRALVSYLTAGMVDEIELTRHTAKHVGIAPSFGFGLARGGFTTTFMGDHLAVVPFQNARPVSPQNGEESQGSYGGSFLPPISHHLAFLDLATGQQATAEIADQQPRAIAWDAAHDALYVAGMGTDSLLQITHASQVDLTAGFTTVLGGKGACGPDGIAIAPDGDVLVWCAFSRSVARIDAVDDHAKLARRANAAHGPALVASLLDAQQHEGMVLFHTGSRHVSNFGQIACANCHFEGRADGLSWQINGHELQTPMLAGRLRGTEPFKWDGTAKDLKTSLRATIERLGGDGLSAKHIDALAAYLEPMPAVRTPTLDVTAVARGKRVFEAAGCSNCHDGAMYTDQARHKLGGTLAAADTPSLIGLATSAPYFHDGSAATLEVVLRERGAVHGMSETSKTLGAADTADLIGFLQSL